MLPGIIFSCTKTQNQFYFSHERQDQLFVRNRHTRNDFRTIKIVFNFGDANNLYWFSIFYLRKLLRSTHINQIFQTRYLSNDPVQCLNLGGSRNCEFSQIYTFERSRIARALIGRFLHSRHDSRERPRQTRKNGQHKVSSYTEAQSAKKLTSLEDYVALI